MSGLNFIDKPEVLAALTYDQEGRPIALARGKVRQRAADMDAIVTWLRALAAQIEGAHRD